MNPKFFWLLTAFVLVSIRPVGAQQPNKIPRIGFLSASSEIDGAFLDGLRQLGYVDKKTILIEHRPANGKLDRLPELANELVNAKVDLIVTQGTPAAQAAKKATATIPIVMATTGDAIRTGLVASLAAPVETSPVYRFSPLICPRDDWNFSKRRCPRSPVLPC